MVKKVRKWFQDRSRSVDMTSGDSLQMMTAFAVPIMVGNLFQQLYSMVDTAVVGRGVGASALAAVGTTSPVVQLLLGLVTGMASGMSVVIAQHFGSGDLGKTRKAIANGALLIMALSTVITAVGILCCPMMFRLIHTPEELMDGAVSYTIITFAGTAAAAAYNYESGVLRAFGNSVVPLLFLILTSLLNVVLDLLFVFSCGWGIAGVAVATVVAELISAIVCLIYIKKKLPLVCFSRADRRPDLEMMAQHIKTGVPMAFFASLLAINFLVLQAALNSLGSDDMAAYTAASKMDTLVYQVLGAFGTAMATYAAQNYGKGKVDRVREGVRKSLGITVAISLALTAFAFLFGRYLMLLFIRSEETEIMRSGMMYMRVTSLFYVILGVNYIVRFALTGVGKTAIPMLVGISEVLTRAAVTYLLVYRIGFFGMTAASPACWSTSTLLCVLCYKPMMKSAFSRYRDGISGHMDPRAES